MNTTLTNLEQIKRAYNLLLAWAENDETTAEEMTCRDKKQNLLNQADNYRALAKAIQPATKPIFIRAFVEGGVLQGISTDQPEQIQVFIWDQDEQDNKPSLWEDSPFEITTEEVERTRHEAAYQAWAAENSDDAPDHRGAEDRIKGIQPLPELDGFKARPATHDQNGKPLQSSHADNVNNTRIIE